MPGFTERSVRRISRAVRTVERRLLNTPKSTHRGRWQPGYAELRIGTLDGALSQGSSATLSVYSVNSSNSWTDTGRNITVYDRFLEIGADDISSGKWVMAVRYGSVWVVVQAECE